MITQTTMNITYKTEVTRTALMDAVHRASHKATAANEALRKALGALQEDIQKRFGPLPDDAFWAELDRFKEIVGVYRDCYGRSNWPEQSADEYFRSAVVGSSHVDRWGIDRDYKAGFAAAVNCVRFVQAYHDKVRLVYQALDALEKTDRHHFGLGEDSFGDMCDSFPLHGREVFEAALEGKIPEKPDLGENYIVMNLDDQALRWLEIAVRDLYPERGEYDDDA